MIRWEIGPKVRCDVITYSGPNFSGKKAKMQIFPTGSRQGALDGSSLASFIVRGPPGTRIVFVSHAGEEWETHPWRAIELSKENSIQSAKSKRLRGVRVPDIDYLDHFDAKTTNPAGSASYPNVDSLHAGSGWTYGRQADGGLRNNVAVIRVEKMGVAVPPPAVAKDLMAFARRILDEPQSDLNTRVHEALVTQLVLAGMEEPAARALAETLK